MASSTASPTISYFLPVCVSATATVTPPAVSLTDSTRAPMRNSMPFFSSASRTAAAMSRSSRGISSANPSSTVTFDPNEAYIEANSSPMYPPPTITRCCGSSSSSMIEVLV